MTFATVWDAKARTIEAAKLAVWGDPARESEGTDECLRHLATMPSTGYLLDLGAGVGRLALPIAEARPAATVLAVDVSARMLNVLGRAAVANVMPIMGGGVVLPPGPLLAGAWSVLTFQHLPADVQRGYLAQMAERLQPGGPLVVQFVTDAEAGPLSNPVAPDTFNAWAVAADLAADIVLSAGWPTWRWLLAAKL